MHAIDFNSGMKPEQWGFDRGLVAPEWEWFWTHAVGSWPFIEGNLRARDYARGRNHGTVVGNTVVRAPGTYGPSFEFSGNANNHRIDLGSIAAANPLCLNGSQTHTIIWRSLINSGDAAASRT